MGAATTYLVIDVGDAGASIRDTTSGQNITVPKLDPNDWNDVPTNGGAKSP